MFASFPVAIVHLQVSKPGKPARQRGHGFDVSKQLNRGVDAGHRISSVAIEPMGFSDLLVGLAHVELFIQPLINRQRRLGGLLRFATIFLGQGGLGDVKIGPRLAQLAALLVHRKALVL